MISVRHLLRWLAVLCVIVGTAAWADELPFSAAPDALKGLRRAGGACTRSDAVAASKPAVKNAVIAKPDLSCAIDSVEFVKLAQKPEALMADFRNAEEFQAFHLDGALNLSAVELASKPFLRSKHIILMGNGKKEQELYRACARLKSAGFRNVRVLRGGIAEAAGGQGVWLGRDPDIARLMQLNADELRTEAAFEANLTLVAPSQAALLKKLPNAVALNDAGPDAIEAAVATRKFKRGLGSIVLIAGKELSGEDALRLRRQLLPNPLLIYREGAEAYVQHLAQLEAVWAAQARGPKQPACGG